MNTDEVQLELFVDFSDIVDRKTITTDIDIDHNEIIVRMELNPQFKDIGPYLLNQCFCHTEQRPLITFKYNDGYQGLCRYDIPTDSIKIDDKFVYLRLRIAHWLDISSVAFGGMYG